MAFAVNETANITDVRRRTSGLVRNAKAYKVPKSILGENLCHLIEHSCGLRQDTPQKDEEEGRRQPATEEKLQELVEFYQNINIGRYIYRILLFHLIYGE